MSSAVLSKCRMIWIWLPVNHVPNVLSRSLQNILRSKASIKSGIMIHYKWQESCKQKCQAWKMLSFYNRVYYNKLWRFWHANIVTEFLLCYLFCLLTCSCTRWKCSFSSTSYDIYKFEYIKWKFNLQRWRWYKWSSL